MRVSLIHLWVVLAGIVVAVGAEEELTPPPTATGSNHPAEPVQGAGTTMVPWMSDVLETLITEFKDLKMGFKDFKTEFEDLKTEVKDLKTGFKDFKTEFDDFKMEVNTEIKEVKMELTGVKTEVADAKNEFSNKLDDVSAKADEIKDMLIRTNAYALLDDINPPLVMSDEDSDKAVLSGFSCTWTYIKRGLEFFAVSAKHCLLNKGFENNFSKKGGFPSNHPTVFADIPLRALELGVDRVGFVNSPHHDKNYIGLDIAFLRLQNPPNQTNITFPEYPEMDLTRYRHGCAKDVLMAGKGASAMVFGQGAALNKSRVADYFVTIAMYAEPGHSGAALFPSKTCGTLQQKEPFAVFTGIAPPHGRGMMVPFPDFDSIEWHDIYDPSQAPGFVVLESCGNFHSLSIEKLQRDEKTFGLRLVHSTKKDIVSTGLFLDHDMVHTFCSDPLV